MQPRTLYPEDAVLDALQRLKKGLKPVPVISRLTCRSGMHDGL